MPVYDDFVSSSGKLVVIFDDSMKKKDYDEIISILTQLESSTAASILFNPENIRVIAVSPDSKNSSSFIRQRTYKFLHKNSRL